MTDEVIIHTTIVRDRFRPSADLDPEHDFMGLELIEGAWYLTGWYRDDAPAQIPVRGIIAWLRKHKPELLRGDGEARCEP